MARVARKAAGLLHTIGTVVVAQVAQSQPRNLGIMIGRNHRHVINGTGGHHPVVINGIGSHHPVVLIMISGNHHVVINGESGMEVGASVGKIRGVVVIIQSLIKVYDTYMQNKRATSLQCKTKQS